ncbi:MAG: dethiobiotin synthase [Gemmatimonadales bacterium]|nr:dethiobiotin synthase [Gemmatimonadales bacterium]
MTPPAPKKRATGRPPRPSAAVREPDPPAPSHPPITLIVGTDTGVGKTWVTCAVARALADLGQRVIAVKPIETGLTEAPSPEEDGVRLAAATGQDGPLRALIRLPGLVAPAIAADQAGVELDYEDLVARLRSLLTPESLLLVEGSGGLLSPLTWSDNHLDLAHSLGARVLLVAADRLGTINHTLMALRVLAAERVPVLGVVLNQPGAPDDSTRYNAGALVRLADHVPVVTVPNLSDQAQSAEAVKEIAGWLLP